MNRACRFVCFLVILAFSTVTQACSKPMKMAIEQWPPYIYTDSNNQPAGVDIELARAIFAEAGCQLIIGPELPRKRRQSEFEMGKLDLLLAASVTPEREVYSRFTHAYRNESVSLFALAKNAGQYQQISSFAQIVQLNITLLAPNTGWYGEEYKTYSSQLEEAHLLSTFEDFAMGMRMLAHDRGKLIMGDTGALVDVAKAQGIDIEALPWRVMNDQVSMMLSKKSSTEQDIHSLNAAISRLEKNGSLKKILARYGL